MLDQEQGARVDDSIQTTCVATSAATLVISTEIALKLPLEEETVERIVTEETGGATAKEEEENATGITVGGLPTGRLGDTATNTGEGGGAREAVGDTVTRGSWW